MTLDKTKILVVFGTRPEAIKMAPVVRTLMSFSEKFEVEVCVTAQHRKMLDQVLEIFEIKPNYDLNLMHPSQSLSELTSRVLLGIREVVMQTKPKLVLVHGDTTTAFATSLACFYESIPVAHVEAGLRTYDLNEPFPEELNRQIVGKIAKIHFAPTRKARLNLVNEGVPENSIYLTGNTVVDALKIADQKIEAKVELKNRILKNIESQLNFDITKLRYILITGHRRENFGSGFEQICKALSFLAETFREIQFVYPLHLNPKVIEPVTKILGNKANIKLIEPQDYLSFICLLKNCHFVLTDSGGIQEEAPSFGKPVLIMRNKTERTEAIDGGNALLIGSNSTSIIENVSEFLQSKNLYESASNSPNPFGDGNSSFRLTQAIIKELGI